MSADLSGRTIEDYSLETCKQYCRPGYVVVRQYRKRLGIDIRICLMRWYKPFEFRFRWGEMNILWLHLNWHPVYFSRPGEIVWEPAQKGGQQ